MEPTEETQTQTTASGPWDLYKQPAQPVAASTETTGASGPWEMYSGAQSTPKPFTTYVPRPKDLKVDRESLQYDPDWLAASRILYNRANPTQPWKGSDKELANWGQEKMSWTGDYYFPGLVVDAARLANSDQQERLAFLYMMETAEKYNLSLRGVGETIRGIALDPTNYVGLVSLVPGLQAVGAGALAGKQAARFASKEALKQYLRTGVIAGIETGAITAAQDAAKQSIYVSSGVQDGIDAGQVATAGAVGAGAGVVLGTAASAGIAALRGRAGRKVAGEGAETVVETAPLEKTIPTERAVTEITTPANTAALTPEQLAVKVEVPEAATSAATRGVPTTIQDVIAAVKKISPDLTENGAQKLTAKEIADAAKEAGQVLSRLDVTDAKDALPILRGIGMTEPEQSILKRAAMAAFEDTGLAVRELEIQRSVATTAAEKEVIQNQIDELEKLRNGLGPLDVGLSSTSGSDLASRVGGVFVQENRGLTRDEILREKGIDPALATTEQKVAAQQEFNKRIDGIIEAAKQRDEIAALQKEVQQLAESGDIAGAVKKVGQMDDMLQAIAREESLKMGYGERAYTNFNDKVVRRLNEYIISTVFTPSTVMLNTVPALLKTLYKPLLNFIVKGPFEQSSFREMTSFYGAMYGFKGAAMQAAKAAFAYERSLLTGTTDKLLETGPVISGLKGRILRTFPRILSATDEFFAQINYRGYIVSQTTADAYVKGIENKLTGKALDDFIKDQVEKAVKNAYEAKTETANIIGFLRQQGIERGHSGDALEAYVKTELHKNGELFKNAADESGRKYVDDLLFKREFSGETSVSRMASGYERFVNNNPMMRLAGQLFFRTPVRVFEEGIRLTPGLNLIAPNFMADLTGKNGAMAQVRAQGEAMLAYSIGASVMALYANGSITGGGPTDWKQRRGLENTKAYDPYTIVFKDGSTFSFRNLDPFATPLKIIVNALDRFQMVQYRKSQGEYVGKEEKEALAWVGVGIGAVAQSIRDASLTAGLDQIIQFAEAIGDPEANETKLTRFAGQKVQLVVPNVLTKVQQINNPMMTDPATIEQFFLSRINPADPKVAKQHDALGNIRTITNPLASMTGVHFTPRGWKDDSLSKKEREVLKALSNIEIAANTSFMAPYKVSQLGDLDLRTAMTSDGKETIYDRWNRYSKQFGITEALHAALVSTKGLSLGSKSDDGAQVKIARNIIQSYRKAALVQLISEEMKLEKRFVEQKLGKAEALAGGKDVISTPFGRFQ